jgi:preprotein translocase subunit SecD
MEKINAAFKRLSGADDESITIYIGTTSTSISLSSDNFSNNKVQLSSTSEETIENLSMVLQSATSGGALLNTYTDLESTDIVALSATAGENAALFAFIAFIVFMAVIIVLGFVKYKKLGFVLLMVVVAYWLVIIYALYLLEVQLTLAGVVIAALGLMLLSFSNLIVLEEVRRQTKTGKTMQSAIKTAYNKTMMLVADIHIVLLVASIITTLVAVGEVSACALILMVATIASYCLYWITRFMWYVISSPVRNKFKFCGFKREVYEDD